MSKPRKEGRNNHIWPWARLQGKDQKRDSKPKKPCMQPFNAVGVPSPNQMEDERTEGQ